jgi:hypothetical protein
MPARPFRLTLPRAVMAFALLAVPAAAQDAASTGDSSAARRLESWLQPETDQQRQAATGESYKATTGTVAPDPFAVLTSGALWQETYGEMYTRDLGDAFSLSCQSSNVVFDEGQEDLSQAEQMGFAFAPAQEFSLSGNLHGSATDAMIPDDGTRTSGAGLAAESHLPWHSIVTVGLNFDRTVADAPHAVASETGTYNARIEQPLGKLPVSAVFKGSVQDMSYGGTPVSSMPSLEQSLVWKPLTNTTLQMGLRQQQYQEYPGVDHLMNEAIFADLSEKIVDNVSWHSYAELLNSKGLNDQAPGAPIASGANGTPQATLPGSNTSLTSSLPLSMQDQTLTFSTGPSVQLQKDISASLEYSNRWDKNPAPGSTGQEQRVSVSVKGTF